MQIVRRSYRERYAIGPHDDARHLHMSSLHDPWQDGGVTTPGMLGARLWLDASDTSGSVVVTGSGISTWTDISGHGWSFIQNTDARRLPLHSAGIKGRKTAQGTAAPAQGVGTVSTMATMFSGATSASIYVVAKLTADLVANPFGTGWSTADTGDFLEFSDGKAYSGFAASTRNAGNSVGTGVLTSPFVWNTKSAANSFQININWAQNFLTATNTVTFGAAAPTIGNAGGNGYAGDIGEIVAFPFILSATQENALRSYFKAKWGTP